MSYVVFWSCVSELGLAKFESHLPWNFGAATCIEVPTPDGLRPRIL